eukprot:7678968-Ditylum_brightwellii.AAC.1
MPEKYQQRLEQQILDEADKCEVEVEFDSAVEEEKKDDEEEEENNMDKKTEYIKSTTDHFRTLKLCIKTVPMVAGGKEAREE